MCESSSWTIMDPGGGAGAAALASFRRGSRAHEPALVPMSQVRLSLLGKLMPGDKRRVGEHSWKPTWRRGLIITGNTRRGKIHAHAGPAPSAANRPCPHQRLSMSHRRETRMGGHPAGTPRVHHAEARRGPRSAACSCARGAPSRVQDRHMIHRGCGHSSCYRLLDPQPPLPRHAAGARNHDFRVR